jgi:hypothetical protein
MASSQLIAAIADLKRRIARPPPPPKRKKKQQPRSSVRGKTTTHVRAKLLVHRKEIPSSRSMTKAVFESVQLHHSLQRRGRSSRSIKLSMIRDGAAAAMTLDEI